MSIVTLPISPGPTLAYIVQPYTAKLIAQYSWKELIIALNTLWNKNTGKSWNEITAWINDYTQWLRDFGIWYNHLWHDREQLAGIITIVQYLIDEWVIVAKEKTIEKCECGLVEIVAGASSHGQKKWVQQNKQCTQCGTTTSSETVNCLVYTPWSLDNDKIYPSRYSKFVKDYDNQYANAELLVSRSRDTGIQITHEWSSYNIDVDFGRGTRLAHLRHQEHCPTGVIANPSSLYNAYLWQTIDEKFWGKTDLYVHPYISVNYKWKEQSLKSDEYFLRDIVSRGEYQLYQLLIWCGLKRWKDIVKVDIWILKKGRKRLQDYQAQNQWSWWLWDLTKAIWGNFLLNALQWQVWKKPMKPEEINSILYHHLTK